jgi:hypothetical protein
MTRSNRPRSTAQAQAGLHFALGTVARPNLVVALWRWRYEIGLLAGLAVAIAVSASAIGPVWTMVAAAALAAAIAGVGESRRMVVAQAWRIITPHRVRAGCAQAWIHSRTGRLPFIVLTTCEPFGERVRIWCRAGISAADFDDARDRLAASCWATQVTVVRSEKHAQLVTLDVIRRTQPGPPPGYGRSRSPGTADPPWTTGPDHQNLDEGEPGSPAASPDWPFELGQESRRDESAAWANR